MLIWTTTYGLAIPNSVIEKSLETREEHLERARGYARKSFDEESQEHSFSGHTATLEAHLEWDAEPAGEATDLVEGDLVTHGLMVGRLSENEGDSSYVKQEMKELLQGCIELALPDSVRWFVGPPSQ